MSNDPSNNSGNTPSDPQQGQVLTWNGGTGNGNGGWQTVPIIPNTSAPTFIPGTIYTITIGGNQQQAQPQQIPLPNIELDLPEDKKKNSDGCVCKKCKELFPYAEPNQDDGTLVCYGCRMTW